MTRPDAKSTGAATPGRPVEPSRPSGTAPSDLRPDIAYTDLREWIDEARKLGEVREASGLTWQDDIGAASEVILHDENAPCVIFDNIPGTIAGSKVLVNFFGGKRQRMTLGFPLHFSKLELSEAFRAHYMADLEAHRAALRQ